MQLSSILAAKGGTVFTVQPDATIAELIALLAEHSVGALVVSTDGRTITGIVSERDVVQALQHGPDMLQRPVASIMTDRVHCAPPDGHIDELMHLMTQRRVRHVPVTDAEGVLLGIVSIGDVVKSRLTELEDERAALTDYITRG